MAESILTSISLAGGSFNVYYDTVLSVISKSNTASTPCPSGWKAAIVISHETHVFQSNSNSVATLIQPITIFNISSTNINYYGTYIFNSSELGTYTAFNGITINQSSFNFNSEYIHSSITVGTIIFVA